MMVVCVACGITFTNDQSQMSAHVREHQQIYAYARSQNLPVSYPFPIRFEVAEP